MATSTPTKALRYAHSNTNPGGRHRSASSKKHTIMNKQRRLRIQEVIEELESIREQLEELQLEEEEAYDNMPDNLKESTMGEKMYEWTEVLSDSEDDVQGIIDELQDKLDE